MFDIVIKNGTVVDGTGGPGYVADVAVQDGKIAEIGKIKDGAHRVIDGSDLVVAPGFIDPHTHYDAQISWDPLVTPSSWHGVTSVVMGNCGVGIAPCKPDALSHEISMSDLVQVEGMSYEVLDRGISWDFETFPQFLDAAAKRGSGINLGFFAPLTPFRHFVMGQASMERAANEDERTKIKALIKDAVAAGAMGWSTTTVPQHLGYKGLPIGCRMADRAEHKAYANALRELGKGVVELALTKSNSIVNQEEYEFLEFLLDESGRKVSWIAMLEREDKTDACQESLRFTDPLSGRGAVPQVMCRPFTMEIDMRRPNVFGEFPSWKDVLKRPDDEKLRIYKDPEFRAAFRGDLQTPHMFMGYWELMQVHEVTNPALTPYLGKSVVEVAKQRGADPLDVFLDLVVEDDLNLKCTYELFNATVDSSEKRLAKLINDPRTMLGLSDGGAHNDMLCDAGYPTYLLGHWVRDRQALSLERAVSRMTSEPASFLGLSDRGRLARGMAADIAIFDPRTIGSASQPEIAHDLPGGARRLLVHADGVEYTIVNGAVLYEGRQHTGALPGQVLRSH